MRLRLRSLTGVVAAALLVSACTGGSTPTETSTSSESVPEAAPSDSPDGAVVASGPWLEAGEPSVGGRITDVTHDPSECDVVLAGGDLLGAVRSEDGGRTWTQVEGLTGREVSRFTWDPRRPGVVWIATMSGPFVSTDGGRSVTSARTGMPEPDEFTYSAPVETVLVDPDQGGRLLAFGGSHRRWNANPGAAWGAVWESTDDGSTWRELTIIADGGVLAAAHTGSGWIASVDGHGVFRSADGLNWDGPVADLADDTVSRLLDVEGTLWAAITSDTGPGGLASSVDGGATWLLDDNGVEKNPGGAPGEATSFESLAVDPAAGVLYAGDVGFSTASVSARPTGSVAWDRRSSTSDLPAGPFASGLIARAVSVSPCDPEQLVVGTDESLWSSSDGARSWTDIGADPAGAGSWTGRGFGGLVTTGAAYLDDGSLLTTSLDGGNLLIRDVDGAWSRPLQAGRPFGGGYDVDARGEAAIVALGQVGNLDAVAVTTDSGATWTESDIARIDGFPTSGELPVSVAIAPDGSWLLAAFGTLWRASGPDLSWNRVAIAAVVHDVVTTADMVVLATDSGIVLTDSTARDVIPLAGPTSPTGDAKLTVTEDGTILAAVWREGDVGVWRRAPSTAGSTGWQQINDNRYARMVAVDPADPSHLMVALDDRPFHDATYRVGVIESLDGGETWIDHEDGLPVERVSVVIADPCRPGHWVVGTHGSGWWESSAPGDETGQDVEDSDPDVDGGPDGE